MSSTQQLEASTGDSTGADKYNRNDLLASDKKKKSPAQDDENTPLLQDSRDGNADDHDSESSGEDPLTFFQRGNLYLQDVVAWILGNLVIVVLAGLLTTGTLLVCVYSRKDYENCLYVARAHTSQSLITMIHLEILLPCVPLLVVSLLRLNCCTTSLRISPTSIHAMISEASSAQVGI